MLKLIATTAVTLCAVMISRADAQSVATLYSRGVHAYFNGQSAHAEALLSQSLVHDATDPRAYYFLALAKMRQGRRYEGEQDILLGATLEARRAGRSYDIGRALERVQGAERGVIERIRRQTRRGLEQSRNASLQRRYGEQVKRDEAIVWTGFRLPLETLAVADSVEGLVGFAQVGVRTVVARDPFSKETSEVTEEGDTISPEAESSETTFATTVESEPQPQVDTRTMEAAAQTPVGQWIATLSNQLGRNLTNLSTTPRRARDPGGMEGFGPEEANPFGGDEGDLFEDASSAEEDPFGDF